MNQYALKNWANRVSSNAWGDRPQPWREIVAARAKDDFLLGIAVRADGQLEATDPSPLPTHLVEPVLTLFRDTFRVLASDEEFLASLRGELAVVVCLHDAGRFIPELKAPMFAFNRLKDDKDLFVVPDPINISILNEENNYPIIDGARARFPWERRKECLFWRGSSTGSPHISDTTWRDNPRVKLSLLSRDFGDSEVLDIGLSQVVQHSDDFDREIIVREGIVLPNVEQLDFMQFKYLLDVDGNANAWGMLQKLYLGSTLFKIGSQYEQWFYSQLQPWKNFIPVEATIDSLVGAVKFARENDATMRAVAENGLELARTIDYKSLLKFHAETLIGIARLATA